MLLAWAIVEEMACVYLDLVIDAESSTHKIVCLHDYDFV